MLTAVEQELLVGVVDEHGAIHLAKDVHLVPGQRVLVAVTPPVVSETALLSEAALGRDWNRPEEDEAWSHLQRR